VAKPSPTHSGAKELKAIGDAIRRLRLSTGMSQEALAYDCGIDRSYLGGIERGEHNVSLVNLLKISRSLELPPSRLLSEAGL
jgi:transcriptional regulator with XRE-family HTH domain